MLHSEHLDTQAPVWTAWAAGRGKRDVASGTWQAWSEAGACARQERVRRAARREPSTRTRKWQPGGWRLGRRAEGERSRRAAHHPWASSGWGGVGGGAVRGAAHCHCARLTIFLRLSCGSRRSLSGCSGHDGEIATPRSSSSSRAAFRASRDAARSHAISRALAAANRAPTFQRDDRCMRDLVSRFRRGLAPAPGGRVVGIVEKSLR